MKQCEFVLSTVLWVVLWAGVAIAESGEESGFFGSLTVGGGYATGRPSQLDMDDDNKVLGNLNDRVESYSEGIPVLLAQIGYAFSTGTIIDVGLGKEDDDSATISISQLLGKPGLVSLGLDVGESEVWRDPYLVGVERAVTDEITVGLTLDYAEIFGTGAMLSIGGRNIRIEDDTIGSRQPDLRRDGSQFAAGAGYAFELGDGHAITPYLEGIKDTRDGESESSSGYRLSLNHSLKLGKWIFDTTLSGGQTEFDAPHPIFKHTREENMFEVSEVITYEELFGFKNFSISGFVNYSSMDANINFFDSNVLSIGMGVSVTIE
jgi:hypothetical protein